MRVIVYDADTLELKRMYELVPESGQTELSGLVVDPEGGIIWLCSWTTGDSGDYLYRYRLSDFTYLGKTSMDLSPASIQGIAFHEGSIFISADDGSHEKGFPDHIYRADFSDDFTSYKVYQEKTLDEAKYKIEAEGISFDDENGRLLVLYDYWHSRGQEVLIYDCNLQNSI